MPPKRKRGAPLSGAADALKKACLATLDADAPQVVTEAMISAADWTLRKNSFASMGRCDMTDAEKSAYKTITDPKKQREILAGFLNNAEDGLSKSLTVVAKVVETKDRPPFRIGHHQGVITIEFAWPSPGSHHHWLSITLESSPWSHHQGVITRESSPGSHHHGVITRESSPGSHHHGVISIDTPPSPGRPSPRDHHCKSHILQT